MRQLGLLFAIACGPKLPGTTAPASATDLGLVADQVVDQLPAWPGFDEFKAPPHIVVLPTENRTKFDFDTKLATSKLVNGLIGVSGARFDIVDPETWSARQAPPKKGAPEPKPDEGQAPVADAAPSAPPPPKPMLLLLHSEVQSTGTDSGDGRPAVNVLVTYRLVESDSARAIWAWTEEWTKAKGEQGYELVQR
ncbi:MAG: hypothetical protein AAGA48_38765 [Myxococcota bacterium]